MSRYDDLSEAAQNLLAGFDDLDLAEMLAAEQAKNVALQQQIVQAEAAALRRFADLLDAELAAMRAEDRFKQGQGDSRGPGYAGAVTLLRGHADELEGGTL